MYKYRTSILTTRSTSAVQNKFSRTLFLGVTPYFRLGGRSPLKIFASGGRLLTKFSPPLSLHRSMPPKSLSSLLLPALDNMPVESPETEDPDAFFEGESFLVQEAEDVED